MRQFQGMIAEYERAQIAERTRRGKVHRARQGSQAVLSGAPLGYRYVRKSEHTDVRWGTSSENNARAGRAERDELRARQFPWPPLRLARVCREHESVCVVVPEGSRRDGRGAQAAGLRTRGGIGARGRSVYRSARDDEEFLVDGDRDQRVAVAATSGSSSAKREGAGSEATSCSQALGDQLLSPLAGSRYCSSSPRTPARVWGRSSIPHPSASA